MDKFLDKLQMALGPIANKLNSNRYLAAIRDGFFGATSIIIIGSMFLLFANLPITGYSAFMSHLLGKNWADWFNVPYNLSMGLMTIYVIIGMAKSLADYYKIDSIAAITMSFAGFLILTPESVFKTLSYLPATNFSASGLFLGMFATILAVEIVRLVLQRGWKIKMPDGVPENVSTSFEALIPGVFVFVIFDVIRFIFSITDFASAQAFIFKIIQTPLTSIGSSYPATMLVEFLACVLFSFGLHGPNILGGVMQPIWLALTAENAAQVAAGKLPTHVVNYQFDANFVKLGGCGATIGLALAMLFLAKSDQFKALGKLAIGPGIFNINEPLIFGIPIVLNPIMIIPFVLSPLIFVTLAYFAMSSGIVPVTNGVNIPWTTPPVIAGFLLSGWRGAVFQVVEIAVSFVLYYPFFKVADRQALKAEEEAVALETA